MAFQVLVEWVAYGLEGMGIAVVSVGGSAAMINFVRRLIAGDAFEADSGVLRERLARATLLGLEFLVAADIIATVAAVPTPARLLMLTGIILLRTFLSATLMLEAKAAGRGVRLGETCAPFRSVPTVRRAERALDRLQ